MRLHAPFALALLALLAGCAGSGSSSQPVSLALQAEGGGPLLLTAIGATLQAVATAQDAAGRTAVAPPAQWSSSDPKVASVSANGLVTAAANGTCTLSAVAGALSASARVVVAQAADTVAVAPQSGEVERGATLQFNAVAVDRLGGVLPGAQVSWAVADPAIASSAPDGLVTGLAVGATRVTARVSGREGQANLTVKTPAATGVSVSASVAGPLQSLGETRQLLASATDARGQPVVGAVFSFTSSDPAIAQVDAAGLVTAIKNGAVILTATTGTARGTLALAVAQAVHSVALAPTSVTLPPGGTQDFTATALDARGHPVASALPAATWSTDAAAVATIDSTGRALANPDALAAGTAHLAAVIAGVRSPDAALTVDPAQAPVDHLLLAGGGVTLASLGASGQLTAQALNARSHPVPGVAIAWATSDKTLVAVDPSGRYTAVANGIATLTASGGGKSDSTTITVLQAVAAVAVTGPASLTLSSLDDTLQLAAAATDARGNPVAGAGFDWSSGTAGVATVGNTGLVTAAGNGTAKITAAAGGKTSALDVTVLQQVFTVTVAPSQATLPPLGTQDYTAAAADRRGHAVAGAAAFSTSNPALVGIDAAGHAVIGTSSQQVQVTVFASVAGVQGSALLVVDPAASTVDHVTIAGGGVTLTALDDTHALSAAVFADAAGTQALARSIAWSTSDASVASIDSTGLVSARKNGTAILTAASGGKSDTATITVAQAVQSVTVATHIAAASTTLASLGQALPLDASAFDRHLHLVPGETFSWASDGAAVSIDANGVATAAANGSAHLTATAGGVDSAGFLVTVAQVPKSVTVAKVNAADTVTLASLGDTLALRATASDALGNTVAGTGFTWRVSGAAVSVDQAGLVTAAAPGAAQVFAKTANNVESALPGFSVTVAQALSSIAVVARAGASATLASYGETLQLDATGLDKGGHAIAGTTFTWRSAAAAVAVDAGGLVTAAANGSAGVFAASGAVESGAFAVTVRQRIKALSAQGAAATLTSLGDTLALLAVDARGNALDGIAVSWRSSAATVAGIDATGVVTAAANGSANLIGTADALDSAAFAVTVQQAVRAVKSAGSTTLTSLGDTLQLTAQDNRGNAIAAALVTWSPRTGTLPALVNSSGLVTARANGAQLISLSGGGGSSSLTVTVQQAIATVAVSPATSTVPAGTTAQLTATPKDARGNAVTGAPATAWTTGDASLATVSQAGVVTGVAPGGPVLVTATIGGIAGTAQVTVTPPPTTILWGFSHVDQLTVVPAGTSVVFHNDDASTHTASGCGDLTGPTPCPASSFAPAIVAPPDTGNIAGGATSAPQVINGIPGTIYHYQCRLHASMHADIKVQ